MGTDPLRYNTHENMTQRKQEKAQIHMIERKIPNIYVTCVTRMNKEERKENTS
jgi:hypothetical protein